MFSRATKPFTRLVRMEGELIPYSDTVVYLGVTMDKELKWLPHIRNKLKKAKALLLKMASLTQSYWGPQPKLMKWMYTGIVRPTVSYAAMVWAHKIEDATIQDELRKLNRAAMNTFVKVPRSTPTRGMEVIFDILPLHLHIKKEGLAAYIRLHEHTHLQWEGVFTNLTNSVSHLRYWDYVTRDSGLQDFHVESDECHVLRPDCHFVLNTSSFTDMEGCQDPADFNVYTDGSKIDQRVGAGILILQNGVQLVADRFRLPNTATVYQAELTAIREAASLLAVMQNLTTVKFFVDSQAALLTFQSDFITSKLALQTIVMINTITADHIEFVWTKAHIGTEGNERADALAKEGTRLPNPLAIPQPKSNVKHSILAVIRNTWQREWNAHDQARQTKIYHNNLDQTKSKQLIQWTRLKLGRYIRAVTGHNNLLYHLHYLDPLISPICRFCLQHNEEFHHLASDCPPLWWERHLITAKESGDNPDWTINQIIDFAYLPPINDAFIKPLYQITTSNPTSTPTPAQNTQDIDDPQPMPSDSDSSNISVMDVTSEESSENNSSTHNSDIDIDDLPDY